MPRGGQGLDEPNSSEAEALAERLHNTQVGIFMQQRHRAASTGEINVCFVYDHDSLECSVVQQFSQCFEGN